MRTVIAIVLLLAAISGAPAQAGAIVGNGTRSCGEWTAAHRTTDALSLTDDAWLSGYLSAYSAGSGIDLPDNGGRTAWVSNYCRDHPLDEIYQAADQLMLELKRRASRR
jgi:hypothetical protein